MNSYHYLDELVREYFVFRGFTGTLKAFDTDLKNEKEKGFRIEKIIDRKNFGLKMLTCSKLLFL